jgi:hypothetical protein
MLRSLRRVTSHDLTSAGSRLRLKPPTRPEIAAEEGITEADGEAVGA